jgi:hypothetical protein
MPLDKVPGPAGSDLDETELDDEILYRVRSRRPGPLGGDADDLESEAELLDVGPEFEGDPLSLGDESDEVVELRKRLNERLRGRVTLPSSRVFDKAVDDAVRLFQWMFDLRVDGVVDALTRQALPLRALEHGLIPKGREKPLPPPQPPRKGPKPPPGPETDVFELVELVEVVKQDAEKWVKGVANDNTDTATIPKNVVRGDKDKGNAKQYINLAHDLEGQAKRHPEYGREIVLKARVRKKSGKKDALSGAKVEFKLKRTDGPLRKTPATIWKSAELTAAQKEGFGSAGGGDKITATTDSKGWTDAVTLTLSMYAGDQFEVSAQLTADTSGGPGTALKTTAKYVVWRKFWYQLTHAKGFNVPDASKASAAYAQLSADMQKANTKEFLKTDLPADLQPRTFMPEYMLEQGTGNAEVAAIGAHNKNEFAKMMTKEAEHPLKAHIIVCEYQCDPAGPSSLDILAMTARTQSFTLGSGNGGSIVSKPPLEAGAKLVIVGEFATQRSPWTKLGNISDADLEIDPARGSTMDVKITLPAAAPNPTPAQPVFVKLQVQTAESYLGESFGSGQILCVYRPKAAAGAQGSELDYNDTVAHELGHMWRQTPGPAKVPASLNAHPLQYVGHGGQGPHCRNGAKVAAGPANWQNASEKKPSPRDGTCIMFHSYSSKCAHVFCDTCKPYLRLQDMSSL